MEGLTGEIKQDFRITEKKNGASLLCTHSAAPRESTTI